MVVLVIMSGFGRQKTKPIKANLDFTAEIAEFAEKKEFEKTNPICKRKKCR